MTFFVIVSMPVPCYENPPPFCCCFWDLLAFAPKPKLTTKLGTGLTVGVPAAFPPCPTTALP